MENERTSIGMQLKFNQYHRILGGLLIVYILIRFLTEINISQCIFMSLIGVWMLVESVFSKAKKVKKMDFMALRYLEVCTAMFGILYFDVLYSKLLAFTCMLLVTIEYYLCFEYLDRYDRNICIFSIAIPFEILAMIVFVIKREPIENFYIMMMCYTIYLVTAGHLAHLFAGYAEKLEENGRQLSRKINCLEEENSNLLENQEKMQHVNEMLGIQKIQLEKANNKIKDSNIKMRIQNELVKHISASLNLDELVRLAVNLILNEIEIDVCAIVVNSNLSEIKTITYAIASQLNQSFENNLENEIQQKCFEKYIKKHRTYIDNHIEETKYSFLKKGMLGSLIIVPFMQKEEGVGALFIGHPKYDYFKENVWFYESIAAQITIAVKNAALYEEMKVIANHDSLTGIYNRGYLNRLYETYLKSAINEKESLAMLLFDIDYFKKINDTYGHIFGDEIIKKIAEEGKAIAKKYAGIIGRYGGEEFIMLFPKCKKEEAYAYATELKENIKQLSFEKNKKKIQVNISGGITVYPDICSDPGELLKFADWAMYYSKQHGRDRITIDSEEVRNEVKMQ